MRTLHLILLITTSILNFGCSKGNEDAVGGDGYCRFSEKEMTVSSQSGTAAITVEWSYSNWKITTDENGFISNLSVTEGGNVDFPNRTTKVTFSYSMNPNSEKRSQDIFVTDVNTKKQDKITITQEKESGISIVIDTETKYQQVIGFGGMCNVTLWSVPALTEQDIVKMYAEGGLGYNILRLMVYTDKNRWNRDLAIAKKAQSLGAIIMATPWSPPASMKSNNSTVGGYLLPENYEKYAEYLASFVKYMSDNGVRIDAISIQNEPDIDVTYDSCDWTPEAILNFIKNYAAKIGSDIKIMASESFNFKRTYTDQLLNDPIAVNNFHIAGGHIYGGGLSAYPLAKQKGKEVWMTEHLLNKEGPNQDGLGWDAALVFAKELHNCMSADFNTYVWWYLKRSYSMLGDGDKGTTNGNVMQRGYVMSHFAKHATGKQRIGVSVKDNDNLYVTAYNSQNEITLVIINDTDNNITEADIELPFIVKSCTRTETTESENMIDKTVSLSSDKKSAQIGISPKSIISIKISY